MNGAPIRGDDGVLRPPPGPVMAPDPGPITPIPTAQPSGKTKQEDTP